MALGLSGCLTTGVVQTAETTGEGNFQFAIEPGVVGFAGGGDGLFGPSVNLSGRYGVSDRVDIGGRIGTTLIEGQVKVMLTEPDPDAVQVALAPHLGGLALGSDGEVAGLFWTKVPLLVDIPVGSSDLVLGPGIRILGAGIGGDFAGLMALSTSVGFAGRVGKRARLMPELGLEVPVFGAAGIDGASAVGFGAGGVTYTFQLGILLGGRDKAGN